MGTLLKSYNSETSEFISEVYDDRGKELFTDFYRVEGIYIEEPVDEIHYQKDVLKYKENGKYGLIDFSGKKITKAKYDDIKNLEFKDGMLIVEENKKYGVINIKGEKILDSKYDKIDSDSFFKDGNFYKARIYCFK